MTDNLKKFLEAVSQDKELTDQFTKAETPEAMIALAAKKGFALTAEDIKPEERTGEVSDEELDAVAGGKDCVCALGGGGRGTDGVSETCACVGMGFGNMYNANPRCICALGGAGDDEAIDPSGLPG